VIVSIVSMLQAGQSGLRIPAGLRDFSLFEKIQTCTGNQPSMQWPSGAKRPDNEADHSYPSGDEVNSECSYTRTPHSCRVKDNITFTLEIFQYIY
jgi:hypothetical protein